MNGTIQYTKGDTVWWKDPNRADQPGLKLGERACTVVSVNQKNGTVLVEFFEDPTALRITKVAIVSPRVLRERKIRE